MVTRSEINYELKDMTTITKESMGQSYLAVKMFNDISSNLDGNMIEKIDQQLSFIFEELTEAISGLENRDAKELLDGAVDTWVTVAGLLQKLEAAGFDVEKAMRKVDENNLSKFPKLGEAFGYEDGFTVSLNKKYQRSVIKDKNGKVRKPVTFIPVDLSDCVPDNFFGDNNE
jgi:hypothetical protein